MDTSSYAGRSSQDSRITGYEVSIDGGATYITDVRDQGHESETFGYSVYELINGTNYTIKVRAVNGKAATLNATPVIPALSSLRATPGYGWVTLSWRDRGDRRIEKYQFSSDDGNSYTSVEYDSDELISFKVNNLDFLKYTIDGLTNGTSYTFKVRTAKDDNTVIGAVSPPETEQYDPLTVTPLFLAPSNLTAAPGASQVTLSWDDPETTEISKYQLKIDSGAFTDIPGSGATTTSHTVTGLTNYTSSYTFELRAYDSSAAGPSSEVITYSLAGPTVPPPPDNLEATPAGGQVTLTWDDPVNAAITGYEVSSDGGASYSMINGSSATTTSHMVTGLNNWTHYYFKVRAVNASGAGAPSKAKFAEPGVVPVDVGNLTATPKHERVELSWADPSSHDRNDGYKVRYKKTNDADWGEWKGHHNPGGSDNGLTIYKLTNDESYDFEVLAYNYIGDGPTSSKTATPVPEVPTALTGLTATPGDGEVTLTWNESPDEEAITSYHISSDGGTSYTDIGNLSSDSDTTTVSYIVRDLTNGTLYTFKVKAQNSAGTSQPQDPGVTETPMFTAPTGLTAEAGDGQVTLTWDYPGNSDISKYQLKIDSDDFADIPNSDATTTSHAVTGLTGGTEKTFAVRAVNGVAATVRAAPLFASPADLTALVGDRQITLNWTNPGNTNINGYEVSSDNGANYTPISLSDDTTNSHIVQNLTNGTEYSFAVRAVNCPANGVEETVEATPLFDAPTGLTATAGYGEVELNWDDPSNSNITGYEFSIDGGTFVAISGSDYHTLKHTVTDLPGGTSYTFAVRAVYGAGALATATPLFAAPAGLIATAGYGAVTLDWDDPSNSNISGYQLSINGGALAEIADSGATTTSHTVTGLTGGTIYTFRVQAVNDLVDGEPSDQVSATPMFAAPTGLTAEAGDGQVTLTWDYPGNSDISKYQLKIDSGDFADIPNSDATTTSHAVTGLTNGTTYTFSVRAVNDSLTGAAAMVSVTSGIPPPPVPGKPGNLTAAPDDGAIALSWTAAEDNGSPIVKYQHQRDRAPWTDISGGATANSLMVTGLVNDVRYTFSVRAVNGMGEGAVASVTAAPRAGLADSEPVETPVPTPGSSPTPEPTDEPTAEPTPTVTATPEPTQQVVRVTRTPEPTTTPVVTATMVPLSAGGAVAATPTAAPVAGPTPRPTVTQMPTLGVGVTQAATIEPTARPTATPAGTPLKEVLSQTTASPLVLMGIGLFALLIAALAAFLIASGLRR